MRRSPRRMAALAAVLLVSTSCTSVRGVAVRSDGTSATSGGPSSFTGAPAPLTPAFTATGKAILNPAVVTIPSTEVVAIGADGGRFTLSSAAAAKLKVGSTFLIRDIAGRKVTGITSVGADAQVDTAPAAIDDLFSDLDVTFSGTPNPAGIIVGGDPVIAAGDEPVGSYDADTNTSASSSTPVSTTSTAPTGLRRSTGAFRQASGCGLAGDRTLSLSIGDITVSPSIAFNADCSQVTFAAEATATSGVISAGLSFRATVAVSSVTGHLTGGASGDSSSASVALNAAGSAGGTAKANDVGGVQKRYKISWDLLKEDYMVEVFGVPFVVRLGVPFIIEPRFSGRGDSVTGRFAEFACNGVLSVAGSADQKDACHASAANIASFISIAPSAIVVAMGFKLGLGPGVVVGKKAVVFGGIIGTAAYAVAATTTGATSAGLLDCIRIDRSLAFNTGIEATIAKYTVNTTKQVWEKKATNSYGSRCPNN